MEQELKPCQRTSQSTVELWPTGPHRGGDRDRRPRPARDSLARRRRTPFPETGRFGATGAETPASRARAAAKAKLPGTALS